MKEVDLSKVTAVDYFGLMILELNDLGERKDAWEGGPLHEETVQRANGLAGCVLRTPNIEGLAEAFGKLARTNPDLATQAYELLGRVGRLDDGILRGMLGLPAEGPIVLPPTPSR